VNEKNQTQTVAGARPVQRDAQGEGPAIDNQTQIKTLEAQEATLFCQRGYGGYIDSGKLADIRAARRQLEPANYPQPG
jgi:hypothetical protein